MVRMKTWYCPHWVNKDIAFTYQEEVASFGIATSNRCRVEIIKHVVSKKVLYVFILLEKIFCNARWFYGKKNRNILKKNIWITEHWQSSSEM